MVLLTTWPAVTDDSGTKTDGTIVNKALTDAMKAAIEALVHSSSNPGASPSGIIDEVVAARGSKASVDARLDIFLNEDGTPKDLTYPAQESGTWSGKLMLVVAKDINVYGNVNAAETDMFSLTIPANAITSDGQAVRIRCRGGLANNANVKTLKIYLGASSVTLLSNNAAVANNVWTLDIIVQRFSTTTAIATGLLTFGAASGAAPTLNHFSFTLSAGASWTGAQTLKFTGQGTTTNDIQQTAITAEALL